MEGHVYQPSSPWTPIDFLFLWCTTTLVPGGANGVALTLNSPKIAACVDNDDLGREELKILRVRIVWGNNVSQ